MRRSEPRVSWWHPAWWWPHWFGWGAHWQRLGAQAQVATRQGAAAATRQGASAAGSAAAAPNLGSSVAELWSSVAAMRFGTINSFENTARPCSSLRLWLLNGLGAGQRSSAAARRLRLLSAAPIDGERLSSGVLGEQFLHVPSACVQQLLDRHYS